jgi:hypothetical protein
MGRNGAPGYMSPATVPYGGTYQTESSLGTPSRYHPSPAPVTHSVIGSPSSESAASPPAFTSPHPGFASSSMSAPDAGFVGGFAMAANASNSYTESPHAPSTNYTLAPPSNPQSEALVAKQAELEREYARLAREREDALLAQSTSYSVPPSSGYTSHGPSSTGYTLSPPTDPMTQALHAKHATREEEYARLAREREDTLLARGASRSGPTVAASRDAIPISAIAPIDPVGPSRFGAPSGTAGPDWRAEMAAMRAEMDRMQRVQQEVVAELTTAPPPVYSNTG